MLLNCERIIYYAKFQNITNNKRKMSFLVKTE